MKKNLSLASLFILLPLFKKKKNSGEALNHSPKDQQETLQAEATGLPGKLLFVARHQYMQDHHNTATLFQTGEINTNSFTPGDRKSVV